MPWYHQSLADTSPPVNDGVETAERISVKKSVAVDDDQEMTDSHSWRTSNGALLCLPLPIRACALEFVTRVDLLCSSIVGPSMHGLAIASQTKHTIVWFCERRQNMWVSGPAAFPDGDGRMLIVLAG